MSVEVARSNLRSQIEVLASNPENFTLELDTTIDRGFDFVAAVNTEVKANPETPLRDIIAPEVSQEQFDQVHTLVQATIV